MSGPARGRVEGLPQTLRSYAFVGDGERGAVLGPHGEVAFLCAPGWHDDAVFASLIGGAGTFTITPIDHRFVWGGRYEPGTLIWKHRWLTNDTTIDCPVALALPADPGRVVLTHQ